MSELEIRKDRTINRNQSHTKNRYKKILICKFYKQSRFYSNNFIYKIAGI